MKVSRGFIIVITVFVLFVVAILIRAPGIMWVVHKMQGKKTVADRINEYGKAARNRLTPAFGRAGLGYPPKHVILVGLKDESTMQVYAASDDGPFRYVKSYPILGASGDLGPKLKEGDCQVPEGIYRVVFLNPNSSYHLSMRLDYPNDFDRRMAEKEGRENLGGDIMIHGSTVSVGCLAMGDEAAEDLFILASDAGPENIKVILSPVDFRTRKLDTSGKILPKWTDQLYATIAEELSRLPTDR